MFWRRKDVKLAGMLAYRKNALRAILVSLATMIFTGVIKYYEYRMIPFLLADYREITTKEAFRLSKELMRGQKMNLFKLDLSFIG